MLITVLILGLFCMEANCHAANCNKHNHRSLLSFSANITTRSSRLDWNASADCCTWEGVTCDASGKVSSLKLPSRGLVGTIPTSIANLSHLSELDLSRNSLTGSFSDGFFMSLSRLQIIDLSYNGLSGRLPDSDIIPATIESVDFSSNDFNGTIPVPFFRQALNLVSFNISNNSFHGFVPWFVCSIAPSIRNLDISYNHFSGSIPEDVRNCRNLESLRGGFNSLTSPLPQDLYQLSALQELYFPENRLNGSLSNEISGLKSLRILALYDNALSGIIPPGIGMLNSLEQVILHGNKLVGILPESLTNCTKLTELILRGNLFSGDLSEYNFSRFSNLGTIDLSVNFFQGSLPTSLFACQSLTAVRLAINNLSGEIPPEVQTLKSLSFLSLSNNSLTNLTGAIRFLSRSRTLSTVFLSNNFFYETLPAGDGDNSLLGSQGFQNLRMLGLGGCFLNGQIPTWLAKIPKLKAFDLSFNNLTGSIPSLLGSLPNLIFLDLSGNQLSGNFPVELTKIPRLANQEAGNQDDHINLELPIFTQSYNVSDRQYQQFSRLPPSICLSSNKISGNIPAEIGRLKFIHVLDLSDNHFSGRIPNTMSDLIDLEKLDLSKNHFSGEIPASFGNLHFLSSFNVAENNLQGRIPTGGQFDTFPEASFEGNPGLCGTLVQHPCAARQSTGTRNSSAKRHIPKEEIIFRLFVGICFGVGFTISTVAMWNFKIEGSFLHVIIKKLMKKHLRGF